jgi:hypothetical protein
MDFNASTQRRRWLDIEGGRAADHEDSLANRRKRQKDELVDVDEQRRKSLVVRSCLAKIQMIGKELKYSRGLVMTAMAYIRRYFEVEPLEGADLAVLILTAYYLAGKVEEEKSKGMQEHQRGVDMNVLCELVKSKRRSAHELKVAAIRSEMKLLAGLKFDLLCFHPLRSAMTLWGEVKERAPGNLNEPIKQAISLKCEGCYLVDDLVFRHPHSVLGAVSVVSSIQTKEDLDPALKTALLTAVEARVNELAGKSGGFAVVKEIAEVLEEGLRKEKAQEADEVYMAFLKRKPAS